jgi:hypothetical protein
MNQKHKYNTAPQQERIVEKRSAKDMANKKDEFDNIVGYYLENNPSVPLDRKSHELEIRFGTNPKLARPISKIDYDNVVKQIRACGFTPDVVAGTQMLRINTEYMDTRTGRITTSNIRAEIVGSDLIQEYCRTNNIQKVIDMPSMLSNKMKFTQKMTAKRPSGEFINKVDMTDYNFRVSYQTEQDYNVHSNSVKSIITNWTDSKKRFRNLNRVRFSHPDYPLFVDVSIVKSAKTVKGIHVMTYTVQEANIFNNPETYEIELEIDNSRVGRGTPYVDAKELMIQIRKCIRIILSGLQGTKYPISYLERESILQSYMKLLHGEEHPTKWVNYNDFVGPSSTTLQVEHIVEPVEGSLSTNIRKDYTVTEKADGDRMLLYIANDGKIFMIDSNMNVMFTGTKTNEKTIFNSLLDGEHIKADKLGNIINVYAAFDVYYVHAKSVREFPFVKTDNVEENLELEEGEVPPTNYRLPLMNEVVGLLKPRSILDNTDEPNTKSVGMVVRSKVFYSDATHGTIFAACSAKLSEIKDNLFEYNTDGLIFTPAKFPVGGDMVNGVGPLKKMTWEHSFKWKPPEYNTIDFLVSVKKDKTGRDAVSNVFQSGLNVNALEVVQYKTLVLRCGFDERKHGFLNPCQDILNDKLPNPADVDDADTYKPVPFQPTNPYDPQAHICNVPLTGGDNKYMQTEEGETFEDDMIVEFKYVMENKEGWQWVPLRVRYDKIAKLRAGKPEYGNAYHVANSNWRSIHYPITDTVISTGDNIPSFERTDEVYYNRSSVETSTQGLRDFHNLLVKKNLITGVANRGDTLVDYAVGKAGDMAKWRMSNLKFVFGIDISKDNIHNQLDGACARYIKACKKYTNMPKVLFVNGDSGKNIRSTQALDTEKDKQITKSVFGNGPKDLTMLGKGVYNQYGVAEQGFNISSCQFAIHYFFENKIPFHQFLRNISECTKVGGHFIGTCYDGRTVFNLLQNKNNGESMTIIKNERKIYEVTKRYDQTGFPDDEMSLGYPIDVYQESINQTFREYLVNFDYYQRVMEDYGFILITKEEAAGMNLPDSTGLFSEMYAQMQLEIKHNPRRSSEYGMAPHMSSEEKRISFMNRYFVFKKVRSVDAKKVADMVARTALETEQTVEDLMAEPDQAETIITPTTARKAKRKVVLQQIPVDK